VNGDALPVLTRHRRARLRIARTFQTPRVVGAAAVLQNVMIGGTIDGTGTFVESLLSLPRHRRDEAKLHDTAPCGGAGLGVASTPPDAGRVVGRLVAGAGGSRVGGGAAAARDRYRGAAGRAADRESAGARRLRLRTGAGAIVLEAGTGEADLPRRLEHAYLATAAQPA
jgi:hypothetical protein